MSGLIGLVSCHRVVGQKRKMAQRMTIWQIPGIDGYGVHLHGLGMSESRFVAVRYGLEASLRSWLDSLRDLQGTVVSVTNENGEVIANQLIVDVGIPKTQTANNLVDSTRRFEVVVSTLTV